MGRMLKRYHERVVNGRMLEMRKNAATNPLAWYYQKPITIADHQSSRWIVEPVLRAGKRRMGA